MIDKTSNEVIILGTSEHPNMREADCWLWKIDPNSTVTNRKLLGLLSKANMVTVRAVGIEATLISNTRDILRLNMFAYDDANCLSFSVTNRNMQTQTAKLSIRRKESKTFLLNDVISYQNDTLLLVGNESLNGIVMKTNLAGNIIWKRTFDHGQTELLNSVACTPNGSDFYVVGLSATASDKMSFDNAATVCLLLYDDDGELIASDFFEGGLAAWAPTLPKVIYLPCGVVLVVYDKSKNGIATELYAKAYSKELTPLWEKQILQTKEEGPLVHFDICVTSEDRFALVGQVNYWDLILYEYMQVARTFRLCNWMEK